MAMRPDKRQSSMDETRKVIAEAEVNRRRLVAVAARLDALLADLREFTDRIAREGGGEVPDG